MKMLTPITKTLTNCYTMLTRYLLCESSVSCILKLMDHVICIQNFLGYKFCESLILFSQCLSQVFVYQQ